MFNTYISQLQHIQFLGNSAWQYTIAIFVFFAILFVIKCIQSIVLKRLTAFATRTKTSFDDTVIAIFQRISPPFYFMVALYFAFSNLTAHVIISTIVTVLFVVTVVYELIQGLGYLIDFLVHQYAKKAAQDGKVDKIENHSMVKAVQIIVKSFLWVIGILVILSNIGVDVTSLLAGLGIGGLAIALALQNILGDIFSSFSIYFDKPFEIGDSIKVGDKFGTVEKIGLKTTHLRAVTGEQIILANKVLTSAEVQNFKRMDTRGVNIRFGVEYGTPATSLKKVPEIVTSVVESIEGVEFVRCRFDELGEYALIFEFRYKVLDRKLEVHLAKKEEILFGIYTAIEGAGMSFAYPTQVTINKKG